MRAATPTLLHMGFRPFFAGATLIAIASMVMWTGMWRGAFAPTLGPITGAEWHAHEMIYGYAMAVVSGFLLTAVRSWTGLETLRGWPLAGLSAVWLGARVALLFGTRFVELACALDLIFVAGLFIVLAIPLFRMRMWRQTGVLGKVCLMAIGNFAFYLGLFDILDRGVEWSIYGGFYLLIGLILTIGARVLPGFIERGIDVPTSVGHPTYLTIASMLFFLPFFVIELFMPNDLLAGMLAIGLAIVNTRRLVLWHRIEIWGKPLLWGLYLAFAFIVFGFVLFACSFLMGVPKMFAIHALGIGGVGMATLSMMARVTLGHTGRDVRAPTRSIGWMLALLASAVFARVVLPLSAPQFHEIAISLAQIFWITAFSLFALHYCPMLLRIRADGQPG